MIIEPVQDPEGDYTLVWHCEPPPYRNYTTGAPTFIVTRDTWIGRERHIFRLGRRESRQS